MAKIQGNRDEKPPEADDATAARELSEARRLGESSAQAGGKDLRDAETFRALRKQQDAGE